MTKLVPPVLLRLASFVGGVLIIYHEVWISTSAEPLLVFVGLWLAGAPIADLLDQLRKIALPSEREPQEKTDETARKPRRNRRSDPPK